MIKLAILTVCVGLVIASPAQAVQAFVYNPFVKAKVERYWERKLDNKFEIPPLVSYEIKRCGPRACIVGWDRNLMNGVDACYKVGVKVICHTRIENVVQESF